MIPVRTASSTFLAWSLLPTFIGYLLSLMPADVPMPPVGEGCLAVAPTPDMLAVYDVELVNDFDVTAICCNAWSFTGGATGNNPTLTLTRGVTYTFGLVGGGSHPFAIRATAGGANIAGPFTAATFTFTPDFVMPTNMVYQCAVHSPMLGNIVLVNPNSPPNASNLSAPETFTEDVALNLTDIVVTDGDNVTTTATLTLSTPSAGSLSTATSGPVTSTYNGGTGVWTASGLIANVNTLLAGLTYTPAANFSSNFTIGTSVSDGIAAAITGSKAMTAIGVNDAPTLGNGILGSVAEDTSNPPGQSVSTIFSGQFADVDPGGTFSGIAVLANAATAGQGTWQYSANAGTNWFNIGVVSTPLALVLSASTLIRFVPALNFNGSPTALSARGMDNTYAGSFSTTSGTESRVLMSTITSGGSTAFASAVSSLSTTIVAVNDPPTASNLSAAEAYTEDVPRNFTDIVAADVDNANVTATLTLSNTAAGSLNTATSGAVTSTYNAGTGVWTASGAIANVNVLLAGLTYTPTLNFNSAFTITTSATDGALAVNGSKTMTGTAVNDAPNATNLNAAESFTEDAPLNLIDIVVSDVDNATTTATLVMVDPLAGTLSTGTSGAVTSTYNPGSGLWSASGPIADVNALLGGVLFTPTADYSGIFGMETAVTDGASGPSGAKTVSGIAVNDPPQATNLNAGETYAVNTPLNLIDIVVSDVDNATTQVSLSLSNTTAGSLNTATSGAVTSTFNSGTGVWNASGAIADVNSLLGGLVFTPAPGFGSDLTMVAQVTDGVAAPLSGSKLMTGPGAPVIAIIVHVVLEGSYNASTGLMNGAMRTAGLVPLTEPYTALGYTYVGSSGGSTTPAVLALGGADAVHDWVVVELRSAADPAVIVYSRAALIQRDGQVCDFDGVSPVSFSVPPASYYLAVRHRNHLGAMTAGAIGYTATPSFLDMAAVGFPCYGTEAQKTITGAFPSQALWAGDVSFNGAVKYTGSGNDRDPILVAVGSTTPNNTVAIYSTGDVNLNGEVKYTGSGNDRDPILVNVGSTTPNNVRTQQLP